MTNITEFKTAKPNNTQRRLKGAKIMTIKEIENLPDSFSRLESLWRDVSKAHLAAIEKTDEESEALPDFASSDSPKAWRCPSHTELPDLKSPHRSQSVDHEEICKHIASNSTHWDKREPLRQRLQWWTEEKARIDEIRKSFDAAEQEQDRLAHYLGRIEKKMLLTGVSSPREMLLKIEIVGDIPLEPTDYSDYHEIALIGMAKDIERMASEAEKPDTQRTIQNFSNIFDIAERLNELEFKHSRLMAKEPEDTNTPEHTEWDNACGEIIRQKHELENAISSFSANSFAELAIQARLAEMVEGTGFLNHNDHSCAAAPEVRGLARNLERLAGIKTPAQEEKSVNLLYGVTIEEQQKLVA